MYNQEWSVEPTMESSGTPALTGYYCWCVGYIRGKQKVLFRAC